MRRKIVLEYGANKKLIARFGVSVKTVNNALNYRHESKLAEKIRFVAVRDFGGVEIEMK